MNENENKTTAQVGGNESVNESENKPTAQEQIEQLLVKIANLEKDVKYNKSNADMYYGWYKEAKEQNAVLRQVVKVAKHYLNYTTVSDFVDKLIGKEA